jgi:hypothetical protein
MPSDNSMFHSFECGARAGRGGAQQSFQFFLMFFVGTCRCFVHPFIIGHRDIDSLPI